MIVKESRYTLRHYLVGALPARLGDEMSGQAILLMGITANSVTLGSTLLAGLTFAAALGGPVLGAWLDRSQRPGKVLATAIVLYAAGLAVITVTLGNQLFGNDERHGFTVNSSVNVEYGNFVHTTSVTEQSFYEAVCID